MMAHRRLMEAGVAGAKNGETVHEHAAEEYNGRQEPAQIPGVWRPVFRTLAPFQTKIVILR